MIYVRPHWLVLFEGDLYEDSEEPITWRTFYKYKEAVEYMNKFLVDGKPRPGLTATNKGRKILVTNIRIP